MGGRETEFVESAPPGVHQRPAAAHLGLSEDQFYSAYSWCLNPVLSVQELFQRLGEELDRYGQLRVRWQREESTLNLYLFVCAVACVADDYLARRWDVSALSDRFPRLQLAVRAAHWVLDRVQAVRHIIADRAVAEWRRQWERWIDRICEVVAAGSELEEGRWAEWRASLEPLTHAPLPRRLLQRRMPLPAAFRNQDLTHRDIVALAERFSASQGGIKRRLVVVGPRTAGAYFAPLVKARLSALGWTSVSWLTIRPKRGLSRWEQRQLRILKRPDVRVLVVDESPNTGKTFQLVLAVLRLCGAEPERIALLAPRNPARPDWTIPDAWQRVSLVTLEPSELYKARWLSSRSVGSVLRAYYRARGWQEMHIQKSDLLDATNARLREHHSEGFHVRLKRVLEVRLGTSRGKHAIAHVLAKSVGWGWLGYHAYIAGTRLAGVVPAVIGLRNGFLFTEWIGGLSTTAQDLPQDMLPETLSAYVAKRVCQLRLAADPCFDNPSDGWTGWRVAMNLLRRAYGPYVGRLKIPALRRRLTRYVSPVPTLIDGRMRPEEWILAGTRLVKVDFEQHGFGKTELNIVDPASDLACAIFEFQLSEGAERRLLTHYVRESGDQAVAERLLLYKLLHGVLAMDAAAERMAHEPSLQKQDALDRRYHAARRFLISQMSRFCGSLIPKPAHPQWSDKLFFLDLDGVFDGEVLGFPHTTVSGLTAIAHLESRGFSVVLNTGRSVEDVREYCRNYALPGGLAEYGSVFVDAVWERDIALIDGEAVEQLARCRDALRRMPGVFVDPSYQYSVRAYRYKDGRTVPFSTVEVERLLTQRCFDKLTCIPSPIDVVLVKQGTDKGRGLLAVKEYLGCADESVSAIGDSDRDLPMLEAADAAYAPAGCSQQVRALSARGRCRVMQQPMQRGLLEAVKDLLSDGRAAGAESPPGPLSGLDRSDLMQALLEVAERPRLRQFVAALDWWGL